MFFVYLLLLSVLLLDYFLSIWFSYVDEFLIEMFSVLHGLLHEAFHYLTLLFAIPQSTANEFVHGVVIAFLLIFLFGDVCSGYFFQCFPHISA